MHKCNVNLVKNCLCLQVDAIEQISLAESAIEKYPKTVTEVPRCSFEYSSIAYRSGCQIPHEFRCWKSTLYNGAVCLGNSTTLQTLSVHLGTCRQERCVNLVGGLTNQC